MKHKYKKPLTRITEKLDSEDSDENDINPK